MTWTEERVAQLRELWGSGKSASEIADILGDVTRNAVIGKAHRLQLSGRPSPIKSKEVGDSSVARKKAPEPEPKEATILNLTDHMCRWPIGDPKEPGFRFCGKPTAGPLPYCMEHAKAAYQQPARQKEQQNNASNPSSGGSGSDNTGQQDQKVTA